MQKLGTTPDLVIIHGTGQVPPFAPGDPLLCWDPGSPKHPGDPFARYLPCCKDVEGIQATWAGLEQALAQNLTRAIGVSNFQTNHLRGLLDTATVVPAVNQCEHYVGRHPVDSTTGQPIDSKGTIEFCRSKNVRRPSVAWRCPGVWRCLTHASQLMVH